MKVRFLYENQNSYEIELDEPVTLNILQIKSMISSQINIDSTSQRWIYKGKILSDNETLETYSFSNGDTIHILKNNINKSSVGVDSSSSSLSSLSTTQASSTSTTSTTKLISVPQFDDAMKYYLNFNANEDDVKNCLSTLSKIISNIIDHPYEEKYRHIKNTNQHFHKKVGSHKGSYGLLQSLGFILNDDEWILTPTSETWNTIVSCQQKLNKFLEKLKNNSPNSLQSTNPSKIATIDLSYSF